RLSFREGRILLAFRYTEAGIQSVVSVETKVWISPAEPNTIAVEIERVRAGAIPLSHKLVQEVFTETARVLNMDVQWYRHGSNPVALLRLEADKRDPTFEVRTLELRNGSMFV